MFHNKTICEGINKVNLNDKMKSIGEHTQYFPLVVVDGEDVVKEGLTLSLIHICNLV